MIALAQETSRSEPSASIPRSSGKLQQTAVGVNSAAGDICERVNEFQRQVPVVAAWLTVLAGTGISITDLENSRLLLLDFAEHFWLDFGINFLNFLGGFLT
ncbi:unnamed protein product [Cuscuta europaea]|uniref:Uncharacterized protein n=1 Tax=Cuscuta europaea TaxID=41803 RepID=A0A9P0YKJ1_CUSEU|nr:unnamed protein product [Cuscuta europaea]